MRRQASRRAVRRRLWLIAAVVLAATGLLVTMQLVRQGPADGDRPPVALRSAMGSRPEYGAAGRVRPGARAVDDPQSEPGAVSRLRPPNPGLYTYEFSSGSGNPSSATRATAGTITQRVSVRERSFGAEVIIQTGTGTFRSIERQWWEPRRVLLVSMETSRPDGSSVVCVVEPAASLIEMPFTDAPLRSSWASEGCSGRIDVRLLGDERVADASGTGWDTWKLSRRMTYPSGVLEATVWFAPGLGLEVKSIRTMNARQQDGSILSSTQTAVLLGHPSR